MGDAGNAHRPYSSGTLGLLPARLRVRLTRSRMLLQIEELVVRNAENLRWALLRGIDETFRQAFWSLQAAVDEAVRATRGVIDEALRRRSQESSAIEYDVERLNRTSELLVMLRRQAGA